MKLEEEIEYYSDEEKDNMELTIDELEGNSGDQWGELLSLESIPDSKVHAKITQRKKELLDKMLKSGVAILLSDKSWTCDICGFLNECGVNECEQCYAKYKYY